MVVRMDITPYIDSLRRDLVAAAEAAGHPINGLERRSLEVRGRHEPVEVIVIRP